MGRGYIRGWVYNRIYGINKNTLGKCYVIKSTHFKLKNQQIIINKINRRTTSCSPKRPSHAQSPTVGSIQHPRRLSRHLIVAQTSRTRTNSITPGTIPDLRLQLRSRLFKVLYQHQARFCQACVRLCHHFTDLKNIKNRSNTNMRLPRALVARIFV